MITGFNTDIERDGVVYHVQTEDKGLASPLILSLVYSGGEILAAKRTPYADLIADGYTDEALAERLKRQHRLICAAINAGRIEELKKMSARGEGARVLHKPAKIEQPPAAPPAPHAPPPPDVTEEFVIERSSVRQKEVASVARPPGERNKKPPTGLKVPVGSPPVEVRGELEIERSSARPPVKHWQPKVEKPVESARPAPPRLPATFDPPPPPPPSSLSAPRDSAYTVYDSRRPSRRKKAPQQEEQLALIILDDEEFGAGQNVTIRLLLQRQVGAQEKPLGGVQLSIKVLGSTFRPQIYAVKTQRDGVAVVSVDLPLFSSGRAAVVIRAEVQGQSVELRRVIQPAG